MALKHNRKRNVGLVHAFLVRRAAAGVLEQDRDVVRKAVGLVARHFVPRSPLARELELFETVVRSRGLGPEAARRVMDEVRSHARRIDPRLLDVRKSALVGDVNRTFGRDFYKQHRVPEYRLLASLQAVIGGWRGPSRLSESVELLGLEEALVRFMTTQEAPEQAFRPERGVDGLVLSLVEKKFEERWGAALCPSQKSLLRAYARSEGEGKPLRELILSELDRVFKVLREGRSTKEVREDGVMGQRLSEAAESVGRIREMAPAQAVQELMLLQRLAHELESE